jgi:hypothetical protein
MSKNAMLNAVSKSNSYGFNSTKETTKHPLIYVKIGNQTRFSINFSLKI